MVNMNSSHVTPQTNQYFLPSAQFTQTSTLHHLPPHQNDDGRNYSRQEDYTSECPQCDDCPQVQPSPVGLPPLAVYRQRNVHVGCLPLLYVRTSRNLIILGMRCDNYVRDVRR